MGKSSKEKKEKKAAEAEAASLANLLLSGAEQPKDSALDDIFANSSGPSLAFKSPEEEEKAAKKRAKKEAKEAKRAAKEAAAAAPIEIEEEDEVEAQVEVAEEEEEEEVDNDAELSELESDAEISGIEMDSDDDAGVEEAYAARQAAARLKALASGEKGKKRQQGSDDGGSDEWDDEEEEESDVPEDDGEIDLNELVHESLWPIKEKKKDVKKDEKERQKEKKQKQKKDKALAHADEPAEVRDARTIFLGNVPVDCSTSRPMKKALIRHVLQNPSLIDLLPDNLSLKADSIRFRSLAFASTIFGRKADDQIAHSRKRAREWRDSESTDTRGVRGGFRQKEEDAPAAPARQPLTDNQKRKVAFIRGETNEGKKVCNAYLVLSPLPAGIESLTMDDIVKLVISTADGSPFEGFTLRADRIRAKSAVANKEEAVAPTYQVPPAEARRTVFMGGLDFAESEENVRAATEAVLVRERGPAVTSWVEGVRLIRDASTGLGKGFGYVLLNDAECVDELLALPFGRPLKVSKRKPRLERCKSGVAAARAKAASLAKAKEATAGAPPPTKKERNEGPRDGRTPRDAPSEPKRPRLSGSNTANEHQAKLAEALAKMPVDERKKIKAVDPDRLMRRQKKKEQKVLKERWERKNKAGDVLGRESRHEVRERKYKKAQNAGHKTGKRFTGKPKK